MKPIPNIKMYREIPTKFLPVVWFEQHFKVNSKISILIYLTLKAPLIGQVLGFMIAIFGLYKIFVLNSQKNVNFEAIPAKDIQLQTITTNLKRLPEISPLMN
jgi:hypothetical protein